MRMRVVRVLVAVTMGACCAAHAKAPDVNRESDCLPYPQEGIRPSISVEWVNRNLPSVKVSAGGNLVALGESNDRLVAWFVAQSRVPILYPGAGAVEAVTRYGGVYSVAPQGQLVRTDLNTGLATTMRNMVVLPGAVTSVHVDVSGRYLAITRAKGSITGDVVVLDDCLIQDGKHPECGTTDWKRSISTGSELVSNAQIDGDMVLALEYPGQGRPSEVVLRRMRTGEKVRSWRTDQEDLQVTDGYAVEWGSRSGKLLIRKISDGARTGDVELGEAYGSSEPACYSVEGGAENLVLVRRWPDCGLGKSGWTWSAVDVKERRIVWRTTKPFSAITLAPGRRILMATPAGVCTSRIGG